MPEKTDGCIDVILKIEESNGDTEPQKESTDDDTSDSVLDSPLRYSLLHSSWQ